MAEIYLDYEIAKQQADNMKSSCAGLRTEVTVGCESTLPTVQAYLNALVDLRIVLKTYAAMIERDSTWISSYIQGIDAADKSATFGGGGGGGGSVW